MDSSIEITEIKNFDLKNGYVVDGFPNLGLASGIAAESMTKTSDFQLAGYVDSKTFPSLSMVRDGLPNYPVSIFVNEKLKVAVFLSHLFFPEPFSRDISTAMIEYAKNHQCKQIISSMGMKRPTEIKKEIAAIGSTKAVRKKIKSLGIEMPSDLTIPGIPGMLLNKGRFSNQEVIVLLFFPKTKKSPDLEFGAKLCLTMGLFIPKLPCNLKIIRNESIKAEKLIKKTQRETKQLNDAIYL
ncbi:MAG: PAC2 family protein [Nitrosopumilaceae archaeon]